MSQPILGQAPGITSVFPNEGWLSRTAMPAGRWAHAIVSYTVGTYPTNNAYVYVIAGGDASFANTSLVSRYDVNAASWSTRCWMHAARRPAAFISIA